MQTSSRHLLSSLQRIGSQARVTAGPKEPRILGSYNGRGKGDRNESSTVFLCRFAQDTNFLAFLAFLAFCGLLPTNAGCCLQSYDEPEPLGQVQERNPCVRR